MPKLNLSSSYVNRHYESFFYRMNEDEALGLTDLLKFYSPHGPVNKVVTYFGAGGAMPINVLEYNKWCNATQQVEFQVVNEIQGYDDIDTFTRDSLPQELSPSYPIEALKAQANSRLVERSRGLAGK